MEEKTYNKKDALVISFWAFMTGICIGIAIGSAFWKYGVFA